MPSAPAPAKLTKDELRMALEAELSKVVSQWREQLGWRARFVLEPIILSAAIGYHLSVVRIRRVSLSTRSSRYLGLICCSAISKWSTTTHPDDDPLSGSLPQVLERFFSTRDVVQILSTIFSTKCLKKQAAGDAESESQS